MAAVALTPYSILRAPSSEQVAAFRPPSLYLYVGAGVSSGPGRKSIYKGLFAYGLGDPGQECGRLVGKGLASRKTGLVGQPSGVPTHI